MDGQSHVRSGGVLRNWMEGMNYSAKCILKKVFKKLGFTVINNMSFSYVPEGDAYKIVARLCEQPDPVIIDGGAHKGDGVLNLSQFFPRAVFHCFEPDPALAEGLRNMFKDQRQVNVMAAALGNRTGKSKLNLNVSKSTNSLLPVSDTLEDELSGLCRLESQIEVDQITIDDYCHLNGLSRVDIVKLDLQGYDYHALTGAQSVLHNVKIVLVEVLFSEIYKGCHLFPDILELMKKYDFCLYTLCGIKYNHKSKMLWADAIFINKRLFRNHERC